jgi:hypothetical protein
LKPAVRLFEVSPVGVSLTLSWISRNQSLSYAQRSGVTALCWGALSMNSRVQKN